MSYSLVQWFFSRLDGCRVWWHFRRMTKSAIYSWAQNSTRVCEDTLKSFQVFSADKGSELHIAEGRYKTQTSLNDDSGDYLDWDPVVEPYLTEDVKHFTASNGNIRFEPGVPVSPTAVSPLTGFEQYAQNGSMVIGSPKIQFKPIPTESYNPRILCTTGAITKPNYTDSKAGNKALAAHTLGGALVTKGQKGQFHLRQLVIDSEGGFTDLATRYTPHGVEEAPRATGLVLGDIHSELRDEKVWEATIRLIEKTRPESIVVHDVWDFTARNHHSRSDPHIAYARYRGGYGGDSVEAGLLMAINDINELSQYAPVHICASNHHDAADRWAKSVDGHTDPPNKKFWHYMNYKICDTYDRTGELLTAFEILAKEKECKGLFLRRNEQLQLGSYLCGSHGDKGINGARGSLNSFAKLGVRNVTGHSHSPGIYGPAVQVGVTGRRYMNYNTGPSTWMHSHFLIYANSQGSLINIIDGDFE